ncbi:hypothetical protein QPK87_13725 [Kamptonema cortianum]|nr:hypothetical protein [Kamptonema cortianum]
MILEISVFEVLRATLALEGDRIVSAVRTAVETSMSSPDAFEVSPGLQRRLGIPHLGYCLSVPELLLMVKPRVQGGCLLRLVVFLKKQSPVDVSLIVTSRPT